MTDKEFKRLGRADLIEIIYQLQKNEQQLRAELDAANAQLESKQLKLSKAGSIAEAVVGLNQVFESAQAAADQYLEQLHTMNADTEAKCAAMLQEAQQRADARMQQADAEIKEKQEKADREIAVKWMVFRRKTQQILKAHSELSGLLKE